MHHILLELRGWGGGLLSATEPGLGRTLSPEWSRMVHFQTLNRNRKGPDLRIYNTTDVNEASLGV